MAYRARREVRQRRSGLPHDQCLGTGGGEKDARSRRVDHLELCGREHVDVLDISVSDGVLQCLCGRRKSDSISGAMAREPWSMRSARLVSEEKEVWPRKPKCRYDLQLVEEGVVESHHPP